MGNMENLAKLTPEQRAEGLRRAIEARRERADFLKKVKSGELGVREAIVAPKALRVPVRNFIMAVPGYGKVKTERLMAELGIARGRRISGLGPVRRDDLVEALSRDGQKG